MQSGKFVAEKVLNVKQQQEGTIVLVQWKNCSIQQATWQPSNRFENIDILIQQYEKSKVNDKKKNFALKLSQKIDCGENPYEETQRHGHFMYGDDPESIENIKIFKNPNDSEQTVTVICEVKWKNRIEQDETGKSTLVILQNSFIDSKTINQFRPDFLAKFYEKKIRLTYQPELIQKE